MHNKAFIIAEAGINHNGSLDIAEKMVDVATEAGVDAVKFQSFCTENMVTSSALKAEYQQKASNPEETQKQMLKRLELDRDAHKKLFSHCQEKGIIFLSSPFDLESVDLLNLLGLKIFKIASGEITNLPLLRKIGSLKKRVILSTGMADLEEIRVALDVLTEAGTKKKDITVLHCNTEYPTPMGDVNLAAMLTIKDAFKVEVGYSDHTMGIEVAIAAVALGAKVLEKHFTLDRSMPGPDHKTSLEPYELRKMVEAIRNIEKALGNGIKQPSPSELKNRRVARKSIVAACDIKKGEIFSENNITVKRPASGINPMKWDNIIGKSAKKNFVRDELIEL